MKNLESMRDGLVTIGRKISYDDVMSDWVEREESTWAEFAKNRGYDSVREWRESYLENFGLMGLDNWFEAQVNDLVEFIKNLYIGPYNGWRDYYNNDRDNATFLGNLDNSREIEEKGSIRENQRVKEFVSNFEDETCLIAVYDGVKFCLIDGHHRASALAVMIDEGKDVSGISVNLKLLDLSEDQGAFDRFFYFEG
jgi:hypothetical protein